MVLPTAKMTGSIYDIEREQLKSKILDFVDLIEGYNLINVMTDDKFEEVSQRFIIQEVSSQKIQTVLGKNYRVNLFENDDLQILFTLNVSYDRIKEITDGIDKLGFEHETDYRAVFGALKLKSSIYIPNECDTEKVQRLLSLFEIK